jgi:anti-sigma regulatory factor (Ser/Thr protein kinase)
MTQLDHQAFLYAGLDEFLDETVPFLREGLEDGEAVVVVVREPGLAALRDSLGPCGDLVDYYDSAEFYRHPVRTLKMYQELVNRKAPLRVRALAEPNWGGQSPREMMEWARYESLINVVFTDSGAQALCPYDQATLSEEVIDQARRTHPRLRTKGGHTGVSADYLSPVDYGSDCDRGPRLERPTTAEYFPIHDDDLHVLRALVAERARLHGLDRQTSRNLVTAVNEVASNAVRHGTPPMGLSIWTDGGDLTCEIADNGFWRPGPLTGFIPPDSALQRGFGLWSVRLLVDLMELHAGWEGTFVRLHVHRSPAPPSATT